MKRVTLPPREGWKDACKQVGFDFFDLASCDGRQYWNEGVAYELTEELIDRLDDATDELHAMCMDFVADAVHKGDYPSAFALSPQACALIEQSWRRHDVHLYGRFDLAVTPTGDIKMLEYNADTPTSLLEASVVQWNWLESVPNVSHRDQFNSIHEKLIERWKVVADSVAVAPRIYFSAMLDAGREDWATIEYLMETATQAGIDVSELPLEQFGHQHGTFVDQYDARIAAAFKLYPWEWMMQDDFSQHIQGADTRWIEPPWKMLLSNKALLAELWRRHKGHPLLLPTFYGQTLPREGKWVQKPILAREGSNVRVVEQGKLHVLPGVAMQDGYDQFGHVTQAWVDLPNCDGFRPVIGSWVVGNESAGIGIREDTHVITGNGSSFVPHYFVE